MFYWLPYLNELIKIQIKIQKQNKIELEQLYIEL